MMETRELKRVTGGGFWAVSDAYLISPGNYPRELWFISLIGQREAVNSLAAQIVKKPAGGVTLSELDPDEGGTLGRSTDCLRQDENRWRRRSARLPTTRTTHTLVYSSLVELNHEDSRFLLLGPPREDPMDLARKHLTYLNARIPLPIPPQWAAWLWARGLNEEEITPLDGHGIRGWLCRPDEWRLKEDITRRIRREGHGAFGESGEGRVLSATPGRN